MRYSPEALGPEELSCAPAGDVSLELWVRSNRSTLRSLPALGHFSLTGRTLDPCAVASDEAKTGPSLDFIGKLADGKSIFALNTRCAIEFQHVVSSIDP